MFYYVTYEGKALTERSILHLSDRSCSPDQRQRRPSTSFIMSLTKVKLSQRDLSCIYLIDYVLRHFSVLLKHRHSQFHKDGRRINKVSFNQICRGR